ncbi:MAG: hypothetical protein ACREQ5_06145 [Candidatus Dormibacteria bacterium]
MTVQIAISLLLALIDRAQQISQIINTAQNANRTTLTPDEWAAVVAPDDKARAVLVAALTASAAPPPPPVQ